MALPEHVRAPTRNGQSITLAHLATHSSGLPRNPDNYDRFNPGAYSVEKLYDFLSRHELQRDVGAKSAYSNLGFGLLGHLLALRSGMTYEQLIEERITKQLGMPDTRIAVTAAMEGRVATPYRGVVEAGRWYRIRS